jgi:hypothetical protein
VGHAVAVAVALPDGVLVPLEVDDALSVKLAVLLTLKLEVGHAVVVPLPVGVLVPLRVEDALPVELAVLLTL